MDREMFVAQAHEMKFKTSVGHSIYIVIPKENRERIEAKDGDYFKVLLEKINLDDFETCKHGNNEEDCPLCEIG